MARGALLHLLGAQADGGRVPALRDRSVAERVGRGGGGGALQDFPRALGVAEEQVMDARQDRIVRRFRKLVEDAAAAGLVVAVDGGAVAIRIILRDEYGDGRDISGLGETVPVHDGCGVQAKYSGDACSSAYG